MTAAASFVTVAHAQVKMIVVVWNERHGEERYLYKDDAGWYVWDWPCRGTGKYHLPIEGDQFVGVTLP